MVLCLSTVTVLGRPTGGLEAAVGFRRVATARRVARRIRQALDCPESSHLLAGLDRRSVPARLVPLRQTLGASAVLRNELAFSLESEISTKSSPRNSSCENGTSANALDSG